MTRLGHVRDVTFVGGAVHEQMYVIFDFCWMPDEILEPALEIVDKLKVRATIFVTHKTPLLKSLLGNPLYEVGIHPDFANPEFYRTTNRHIGEGVVCYFRGLVPRAVTVHSHNLTQSAKCMDLLLDFGIKYDVSHFVPFSSGKAVRPFKAWNRRLLRVPYFWEDQLFLLLGDKHNVVDYVNAPGLRVFNFHLLHLYLNTHTLSRLHEALHCLREPKLLKKLINTKHYGIRNFLEDIVGLSD